MNNEQTEMQGSPIMLQAKNICKTFGHDGRSVEVLRGVNLSINPGEMIAVVGASGSGKTTLLQILGTLDGPSSGELIFRGDDLASMSENKLSRHRNQNIGFIFQFHHLLPEFTALENIIMPGLIQGMNRKELQKRGMELLERTNMTHRATHRSGELSGGEQQRVALARALIMQPTLLLADEPTGNLDSENGQRVFDMLQELSRSLSLSVVMVTHNQELAGSMDRCLTLKDGILTV